MAKLDENLFGRIAVLGGYVTMAQLRKCVAPSRSAGSRWHIGDLLLEKGYLSRQQFDQIDDIGRKKARVLRRDLDEARKADCEFGVLAQQQGLIDIGVLEDAILEQQRLDGLHLRVSLAEVLFTSRAMEAEATLSVLSKQGRRVLGCPGCDGLYRIIGFEDGLTYRCPDCGVPLVQPAFLDSMIMDAVLESEGESQVGAGGSGEPSTDGVPLTPEGQALGNRPSGSPVPGTPSRTSR